MDYLEAEITEKSHALEVAFGKLNRTFEYIFLNKRSYLTTN